MHARSVTFSWCFRLCFTLLMTLGVTTQAFGVDSNFQLQQNVETLAFIAQRVSIALGLCMMLGSFFKFKKYGEARTMMMNKSIAGPIMMMLSGVLLLSLPEFMKTFLFAVWGSANPLGVDLPGMWGEMLNGPLTPVVMFIRLLGVCSFIRGFMNISKAGREGMQPGTFSKSMMYIFGGVMAIHIVGVFELFAHFFGFNL